ncbi:MAG: aminotransferase class I/II-fold pyridoxal phosphate-dependent enzyme [Rhodanobacteraceae bacterium]|mgnify:CR=1 FL=1|nr:aminotransferase class I/II-fold pyridoxal phosphate-dependent enzyme [Rhodanobacteraceae bacterium]
MKQIRTVADLAINGAPPAFDQPLHVGRPNIGDQERFLTLAKGMLERRWLTNNGPLVQEFESRIAAHLGVKHCVAMCNGTIALEIAIRALGLEGEVIVPSWTFIATAHALYWQGITPVFADIDPATHNLDPDAVRAMITPRTTGIIGVHLWGRPAPVEALQAIADEHGLQLMFDAAHAFGCSKGGQKIGSFGRCEVLSFHATKVFNAFEGGAVVTNDDDLAEAMRLMRNFGFAGYDDVIHPGTNGKMPEINAAMGLVNLEALPDFIGVNRGRYAAYWDVLADIEGVAIIEYYDQDSPNYQYVVVELSKDYPVGRERVVASLHAENILARKYFWPGCHGMRPYRDLYPHARLLLPNTKSLGESIVVLPTGNAASDAVIATVGDVFNMLGKG